LPSILLRDLGSEHTLVIPQLFDMEEPSWTVMDGFALANRWSSVDIGSHRRKARELQNLHRRFDSVRRL
jgi:hypothetical protein